MKKDTLVASNSSTATHFCKNKINPLSDTDNVGEENQYQTITNQIESNGILKICISRLNTPK